MAAKNVSSIVSFATISASGSSIPGTNASGNGWSQGTSSKEGTVLQSDQHRRPGLLLFGLDRVETGVCRYPGTARPRKVERPSKAERPCQRGAQTSLAPDPRHHQSPEHPIAVHAELLAMWLSKRAERRFGAVLNGANDRPRPHRHQVSLHVPGMVISFILLHVGAMGHDIGMRSGSHAHGLRIPRASGMRRVRRPAPGRRRARSLGSVEGETEQGDTGSDRDRNNHPSGGKNSDMAREKPEPEGKRYERHPGKGSARKSSSPDRGRDST